MGLFSKLFKSEDKVSVQPSNMAVAQDTSTNMKIDMSKSEENLNKVLIDMSKSSKIDMTKHEAKVALAMDFSGSMDSLYYNGSVQAVITRLLPIALKFDDNGELESWLFSNGSHKLDPVNADNYQTYVDDYMLSSGMNMGGTNYAPVLKDIVKYCNRQKSSNIPAFIIFITDGANWDTSETDQIIREISKYNMFIQFVGIGNDRFDYLRKLDDLDGRDNDNTGFIAVKDMNRMSDLELYTELLRQYKDWLNNK